MATYYFRNTADSSWGIATNWSLSSGGPADGAVPVAGDIVILDGNSYNQLSTAGANRVCFVLDSSLWTGTIAMNNIITVTGIGASIVLSKTTMFTGSSELSLTQSGGAVTYTSNGAVVPNLRLGSSAGVTINDAIVTVTNLVIQSYNPASVLLGNRINVNGNLTHGGTQISSTTIIALKGSGVFSWNGIREIGNPIELDCGAGTYTMSGTLAFADTTFTRISGNAITTGSTLQIRGTNLNVDGITWNSVVIPQTGMSLLSKLSGNYLEINKGNQETIIGGTHGFEFSSVLFKNNATVNLNFILKEGVSYVANNSLSIDPGVGVTIKSSTFGVRASLKLTYGGTQNIIGTGLQVLDIDSSGGHTLYAIGGTLTNTVNWRTTRSNNFFAFMN